MICEHWRNLSDCVHPDNKSGECNIENCPNQKSESIISDGIGKETK